MYENEEFNLLQHALNIEDGLEGLRYNNVVIATDADVDGMHILVVADDFLLQFFPDLVKQGHVFILDTPLFRVRNKQETIYCYDEAEKQAALKNGGKPEITRFKGLGEISPKSSAASSATICVCSRWYSSKAIIFRTCLNILWVKHHGAPGIYYR